MFRRVLIANRGEIAVRVARCAQEMGMRAVALYSEPDRTALHVRVADEAYPLGGKTATESYLRGEKIIDIAKAHGINAIHPGYGFLSENAGFAQACADAGVTFVGPSPVVIRTMGDKVAAKERLSAAGVPVMPGWSGEADVPMDAVRKEAAKIGYPVLIKAAAGGGGKGMRVVHEEKAFDASYEAATREAKAAFGDGRVFLEKYLTKPRHVEIQIFGDTHGNYVHLFERECSIQRRHQKIIEETPSPALTDDMRRRMGDAAVRAAEAIQYTGAGTVEFLVDEKGTFYFLEVNTRLQVEHPITELTVGHDLVRTQFLVAAGEPLPFSQDSLAPNGHAIECRICAEDPKRDFMPATGVIRRFVPPEGAFLRLDSGVVEGSEVTVHYDSMLAKLIAWGRTREESIARMDAALSRFVILGVKTNIAYLQQIIRHPAFLAGDTHTGFLPEHGIAEPANDEIPDEAWIVAALMSRKSSTGPRRHAQNAGPGSPSPSGPWQRGGAWRVG